MEDHYLTTEIGYIMLLLNTTYYILLRVCIHRIYSRHGSVIYIQKVMIFQSNCAKYIRVQSASSSVQRHENPSALGLRRHKVEESQSALSHGFSAVWRLSVLSYFTNDSSILLSLILISKKITI